MLNTASLIVKFTIIKYRVQFLYQMNKVPRSQMAAFNAKRSARQILLV